MGKFGKVSNFWVAMENGGYFKILPNFKTVSIIFPSHSQRYQTFFHHTIRKNTIILLGAINFIIVTMIYVSIHRFQCITSANDNNNFHKLLKIGKNTCVWAQCHINLTFEEIFEKK
jgi:hypothetical protein